MSYSGINYTIERVLLGANYPNLTELKIFNFEQNFAVSHFTNESPLQCIFQEQITDLILGISDRSDMIRSSKNYTINVYGHIFNFF
ncbi:unnamed protein product [Rotaria magnacalcarata]|uniref:Uncharacterized protein n=1 Tax=Rotaria magnacalcarata TaxID=392030 RepID=A0A8S2JED1_9BILA|nr:unnamed protein product [Rotaria magnacalcarata]CAF3821315.1 unnamed protein product [Rotaria magnacalcarata]CAF3827070.1 unnamed protein product [Rotaria magnacalcarata]